MKKLSQLKMPSEENKTSFTRELANNMRYTYNVYIKYIIYPEDPCMEYLPTLTPKVI